MQRKISDTCQVPSSIVRQILNHLTVIKCSAFFLKEKLHGTNDERIKRHLELIDNQIILTNKITNDILSFTTRSSFTLMKSDMNRIIRDVLMDFNTVEDTIIETHLDKNLPAIVLDPTQILRVFRNIIFNSLQAMPEGGVLDIRTRMKDNFVEIVFKDTGVGIVGKDFQKIFDLLFTTKTKGYGLGLTLAKSIIDEHDGSIFVESDVGRGTSITLSVPMTKEIT